MSVSNQTGSLGLPLTLQNFETQLELVDEVDGS